MERKRRINFANISISIVLKKKPTKLKPHPMDTIPIVLKDQPIIGDTPLEAMACMSNQAFRMKLEKEYDDIYLVRVDSIEIIKYLSQTNFKL